MHLRKHLGPIHLYIGLSRQRRLIGVNSRIDVPNKHMLMWDFDGQAAAIPPYLALDLKIREHRLPPIYLLDSSPFHFHAYCFVGMDWREAFRLVEETPGVDPVFLKLAYLRGHFTLRIQDKRRGVLRLREAIPGLSDEHFDPLQLKPELCQYWTKKR